VIVLVYAHRRDTDGDYSRFEGLRWRHPLD